MITLSIYKIRRKQCGDIRNLHKAVKTLWRIVERGKQKDDRYRMGCDCYYYFKSLKDVLYSTNFNDKMN
jgi:hypothetical protein